MIAKIVQQLMVAPDWTGVFNVYDRGVTTPYQIGVMLAEAGLREKPTRIEKTELDTWHKPRRVDTVIHDRRFEERAKPRDVADVLRESIASIVTNRAEVNASV